MKDSMLASLVDEFVYDAGHRLGGTSMPRCSTLARRTVKGGWPPHSTSPSSCGASWSAVMTASSRMRSVSKVSLSGEKGSEENPITVMDTRFLNGAP